MITNTTQGQKSLALLLDEIEQGAKDAGIPDLFKLRKTQGLLVKALRRAMKYLDWALVKNDPGLFEHREKEITAILEGKEQTQDLGEPRATNTKPPTSDS